MATACKNCKHKKWFCQLCKARFVLKNDWDPYEGKERTFLRYYFCSDLNETEEGCPSFKEASKFRKLLNRLFK